MDLNELIEKRIKSCDIDVIVKIAVIDILRDQVKEKIIPVVETEVAKIIKDLISENFKEGFIVCDGWGKKQKYESFEELVKQTLKRKIEDTDYITNKAKQVVIEKLGEMLNILRDRAVEQVRGEFLKSIDKAIKINKKDLIEK